MLTIEAEPGQNVYDFAMELLAMAKRTHTTIAGRFNQYTLVARPDSTTKDVIKPWDDGQRESYLNR